MKKVTLFEDKSIEVDTNLFAGIMSDGGEWSRRICGDYVETKID